MLEIKLEKSEKWNEVSREFFYTPRMTVRLEHSLVAISKWETKFKKPFLSQDVKTEEEFAYYIECMDIGEHKESYIYSGLLDFAEKINNYIEEKQTATIITANKRQSTTEIITSELIYYWMIESHVPMECQYWNLGRLLTLIEIYNIKNGSEKSMSKDEIYAQNRSLNAARRAKHSKKG